MKKKLILAAVTAALIPCLFTSCLTSMIINGVTAAAETSSFKKNVANNYAEYNPTNSAIVYDYGIYGLEMVQQNPKLGYKIYRAQEDEKKVSNFAVLPPIPVNAELAVLEYYYNGYRTIYIVNGTIQGVDYVVTKPGLLYTGLKDPNKAFELEATKSLLKYYSGTEWEPVINARIEELKNAKKK